MNGFLKKIGFTFVGLVAIAIFCAIMSGVWVVAGWILQHIAPHIPPADQADFRILLLAVALIAAVFAAIIIQFAYFAGKELCHIGLFAYSLWQAYLRGDKEIPFP